MSSIEDGLMRVKSSLEVLMPVQPVLRQIVQLHLVATGGSGSARRTSYWIALQWQEPLNGTFLGSSDFAGCSAMTFGNPKDGKSMTSPEFKRLKDEVEVILDDG